MKFICTFMLLTAIACSSLFGLMFGENEKFIQGKWRVAGEHKSDDGLGKSWFLEWEFNNGRFKKTGYPQIKQEGNYKIIHDEKTKLTLKLYGQSGTFGNEDSDLIIIIDKENKSLEINGKSEFKKITMKKTV